MVRLIAGKQQFRFNRRISVLAKTLEKAGTQMASFSFVFVIVNMAFNSALYILLFDKVFCLIQEMNIFQKIILVGTLPSLFIGNRIRNFWNVGKI